MKRFLMLALLLLAGCNEPPVETAQTDNRDVPVELLFTHDGCKVYRFYDGGRNHYWADCRGQISSQYKTSCGKGCVRYHDDEIPTAVEH